MLLEKNGVQVEKNHPADIARFKALGYQPVAKLARPVVEEEPTPEQQNAAVIEAVNTSKGTPKTSKGGDK